jgi:hypothetical protein
LSKLGEEIRFNRLGVETKLSKLGVETTFNKLGVETRPLIDETYPVVPRPATVDCRFPRLRFPLPTVPNAVEKEEIAV